MTDHQSNQSRFVQQLATLPALTALGGLIASFPVVKLFASNAVPLLHGIRNRRHPEKAEEDAERAETMHAIQRAKYEASNDTNF